MKFDTPSSSVISYVHLAYAAEMIGLNRKGSACDVFASMLLYSQVHFIRYD